NRTATRGAVKTVVIPFIPTSAKSYGVAAASINVTFPEGWNYRLGTASVQGTAQVVQSVNHTTFNGDIDRLQWSIKGQDGNEQEEVSPLSYNGSTTKAYLRFKVQAACPREGAYRWNIASNITDVADTTTSAVEDLPYRFNLTTFCEIPDSQRQDTPTNIKINRSGSESRGLWVDVFDIDRNVYADSSTPDEIYFNVTTSGAGTGFTQYDAALDDAGLDRSPISLSGKYANLTF
ncbi:MAG: hypothetical protein SVU32_07395, partial [Candidatus Nanohaloarchaea archaeon]|nr:hypothetical protein [Candidatus Nanohaloarchaea archaeon]